MLSEQLKMVREFMEKHGQAINQPVKSVVVLRYRLMLEELSELFTAIHEVDLVQVADALADLMYVVLGSAIALTTCTGLLDEPEPVPELIQKIQRFDPFCDVILMKEFIRKLENVDVSSSGSYVGLLNLIFSTAHLYGIPLLDVFAEVHRSNMSKAKLDANQKGGKVGHGNAYHPPDIAKVLSACIICDEPKV